MVSTSPLSHDAERDKFSLFVVEQQLDPQRKSTKTPRTNSSSSKASSRVIKGFVSVLAIHLSCFLTCIDATSGIIQENQPITLVHSDHLLSQSFHGNQSHVDHFRLLQRDGDSLLIGARNFVYNISIHDLTEDVERRIEWVSRKLDSKACFNKGKSEDECHNYIRVLAKKDEGEFLVCGTNAFKPRCRDYSLQTNGSFSSVEYPGEGKCPFDPRDNSTFVYVDGHLYSGTVADFQGNIPLVVRDTLYTHRYDHSQLDAPDFVHSFEYGDYVFFFFREIAAEYMNCGKKVYSRVARVCKDDKGVNKPRSTTQSTWTSFLKSRLNCSFPGDYPFYFDEIQSVSDVVLGRYGGSQNEMIYAIFTTPQNSIPGSAVCAFSMRDILDTFEGSFKEKKERNSNWLPVPQHRVPEPRPGSCVNDSLSLDSKIINFVRSHPLMDELVPPFHGEPVFMKASFKFRFTKIAVDAQVPLLNGGFVDVLFVATGDGKIMKIINTPLHENQRKVNPIIIEELHVFSTPVSINNLQIANKDVGESKLIIITDVEVKAIPLERCASAKTCGECIALQDPYCGWFPDSAKCDSLYMKTHEIVLQNVSSGFHKHCPYNRENQLFPNPSTQLYTTEVPPSPTPEVETCPPCECTEISTPKTDTKELSVEDGPEHPTLQELPVSENEIVPSPKIILQQDHSIGSTLPHYPGRSQPLYPTQAGRVGKELPGLGDLPIDSSITRPEATRSSEGVTGPVIGASIDGPLIYSAETLAIAVTTACVAALVVGFISGFLFSRKCRGDDDPPFSDTPYLDSKLNKCENIADPNMYTANNASLPTKQLNNMVTNYKNTNNTKSNANNTDNKLLKPAKCAYI